jgi:HD-GYP domain-containing protein (c-di-GMP phosphodiesterase class II)
MSSERQVRDVLLQILSERRAGGSAVALPHVAAHAIGVGRRLGLPLGELDDIVRAAEMQDIGMLAVPEAVLHKRAALEPEEWAMIHRHPVVGERIIAAAPALAPVARLVRSSYERFDGTGYPDGLQGEAIPLGSRVIAVCVAYDAMTSVRPYRAALPAATAFEELRRCAGHQFDPMIVAAFCAELEQHHPEPVTAAAVTA